jgi:hypothetical protein
MIETGRSIARAIEDGNAYEIHNHVVEDYFPPACETPEEVIEAAVKLFNLHPPMVFQVKHIYRSGGNCDRVDWLGWYYVSGKIICKVPDRLYRQCAQADTASKTTFDWPHDLFTWRWEVDNAA